LIVGTVLAPRMGEFLGKLSIAEAMGSFLEIVLGSLRLYQDL